MQSAGRRLKPQSTAFSQSLYLLNYLGPNLMVLLALKITHVNFHFIEIITLAVLYSPLYASCIWFMLYRPKTEEYIHLVPSIGRAGRGPGISCTVRRL
jgi:hypothetical protein